MSKKVFLAKRSIFFFSAIFIAVTCIIFKGPIFHFALKTYVSHKIPLEGNWGFNYSYISIQEKGAAFHDIVLYSEENNVECKIGKIFCRAPSIENISFSNHFVIEDLDIVFSAPLPDSKGMTGEKVKSILNSLRQVEIKNGSVSIPDESINFSLGKSISQQKLGELVFSKDLQGLVKCELSSWADRLIIDIEARQSVLSFYKTFVDFFLGEKTSSWNIEKGRLDGRAFLAMSPQGIKDMRVHMNLLDGKFKNESLGMVSSFDRVFLDLNYPIASEEKSFIENIRVSSSVDKGEITAYDEMGDTRFAFKDLSGFVSVSAFKEAAVELSGFVDDKERLLPIKLVGKPANKNKNGLELDLSLQLDPVFGQRASVNVVCHHQDEDFLLTSRLDSLKVQQMMILQVGLGLLDPSFKDYTISDGSYSGDLHVVFNGEGVKDFSLRNLQCDDLAIYSEKDDVRLEAESVSGEVSIDLFQKKKTKISDWKVEMKKADCIIGREGKLPFHFENIELKAEVENGEFFDSTCSATCRGIDGFVTVEGDLSEPVLDIQAKTSGNDFLNCFVKPAGDYDSKVSLSSQVVIKGTGYRAAGVLSLLSDDVETEVSFGCEGLDKQSLKVEFSSEKFSGKLFPFLNEITHFDWSLDGDFAFKGNYQDKKIVSEIEGSGVTYREKHSFIKEAEGSAFYVHDFTKDEFCADIFLSKGHKKVLWGKNLFLENAQLRISSDDAFFKIRDLRGLMELDELGLKYFVCGNQFDIYRNGDIAFDLRIDTDELEICRVTGDYQDKKVVLNELSHLLDAPIDLKVGDFSEDVTIALESSLNFNDVPFPKKIRERGFGDVKCQFRFKNDEYDLSLNDDLIALRGGSDHFEVNYKDMLLKGDIFEDHIEVTKGQFDVDEKHLGVDALTICKQGAEFKGQYSDDLLSFEGSVKGSWADRVMLSGKGRLVYSSKDLDGIKISSLDEFDFEYDQKGVIHNGKFAVLENQDLLGEFYVKSLIFHDGLKKISLHGIDGLVGKDVLERKFDIGFLDENLSFSAEADIFVEEKDFWISGDISSQKINYAGHEMKADNIHVRANTKSLIVDCSLPLYGSCVDLSTHLFFEDKKLFQVEGKQNLAKVLDVYGSFDEKIEIFKMKGDLLGMNFELIPDDQLKGAAFKCEMALDLVKMKPLLPEGAVEFIERMGLGSGLEIVGELDVRQGTNFSGVLKGTDFDFLDDYCLSSLFANLQYKDGLCSLSNFSIADRSFMAECEEAIFDASGDGCLFSTKKLAIRNLRPCLLSGKGQRKKVSNPFMIKDVEINDIEGNLADLDTLKGKGQCFFVNSFDRHTNLVFDFAKEIIGRIGLDPVLMIPVEGIMDFTLAGGKMNFTKLHDAYSDKKRSYFYLWHKTPSYIDFDGNIHIDIRMKQYALLKFTELFIISLDGPISNPKVSLK